jgi:hypothetical protein
VAMVAALSTRCSLTRGVTESEPMTSPGMRSAVWKFIEEEAARLLSANPSPR